MKLSKLLTLFLVIISCALKAQNVGIATSTPLYRLDVDAITGTTGNPARLLGLLAGSTSDSIISSNLGILRRLSINQILSNAWSITGNSGTTAGTNFIGTTDAQDLVFKTNSTERARLVNSTGHFGVNTTAPAYRIQVEEPGGSDGDIGARLYNTNNLAYQPSLIFQVSNGTRSSPSSVVNTAPLGAIRWGGYDGSAFNDVNCAEVSTRASENWSTTAHGTTMYFKTIANGTTTTATRMTLSESGAIGMGTTTPTANLHLYGSGQSGFTPTGAISVTGGPEVAFSSGLFTKSGATIQMIDYDAYSSGLTFNVHKGANNGGGGSNSDNWPTDAVQAMTIDNNGNVGIGTVAPNTIVDIDGGLSIRPSTTVNLTADNQAVTVGNRSMIVLTSTSGTATSRTFTLSSGLQSGQVLVILLTSNAAELADSGNCNLASTYAMTVNDTITLIWNGSTWYETSRSAN